jgi:prolyl oligopeptidase
MPAFGMLAAMFARRILSIVVLASALGCATDDPYLWLEDVEGAKPLAWVQERNAETVRALATGVDGFVALRDRLRAILDSEEQIPYVAKRGPYFYGFWQDAEHERGIWRRTTPEQYARPDPQWELLLDLDALASEEGENWVWAGARCLPPQHDRCLLSLSRGGGDAVIVREFEIGTRRFVPGGFTVPEAKTSIGWIDRDTVHVGTDFGPGSLTSSGYPRIVKEWKRGTPMAEARTIYEGAQTDVSVGATHDFAPGFERDFVYRAPSFFTSQLFLRGPQGLVQVEKPDDAEASVHREWLFLRPRRAWTIEGRTYPPGSLLAARFESWMRGERTLDVLFEPAERVSLGGFSPMRERVLINELDNLRNRVSVLTHGAQGWTRELLPAPSELASVSVGAADPDYTDEYFMTVTGYLTPTALYFGRVGEPPTRLKALPDFFDASGLRVSQHEARSADGTRVPYFEVRAADRPAGPTLLYGYGGFEVSMLPSYGAITGAAWLERGGSFVVANIRGGGEFGPAWHEAARKEKRHNAYDDFIAVAEDLIRRGVTRPESLGIMGGSNGGLLVGNLLTLRPDLIGAVVCQVPLLDMRRYTKLLAGASWIGEYGDPDDPRQWEFIRTFSPYHNVKAGVRYPRVLFTTSTRDDRVHPGHARKMVARMREQGHPVLYYENVEGGHAGAANHAQRAFMSALEFTFLWNELAGSEPGHGGD